MLFYTTLWLAMTRAYPLLLSLTVRLWVPKPTCARPKHLGQPCALRYVHQRTDIAAAHSHALLLGKASLDDRLAQVIQTAFGVEAATGLISTLKAVHSEGAGIRKKQVQPISLNKQGADESETDPPARQRCIHKRRYHRLPLAVWLPRAGRWPGSRCYPRR